MLLLVVATPLREQTLKILRIFLVSEAVTRCRSREAKTLSRAQLWFLRYMLLRNEYLTLPHLLTEIPNMYRTLYLYIHTGTHTSS